MNQNNYSTAGWLSIAQAVLFPTAMIVGFIQGIIGVKVFEYTGPTVGPSDFMTILATGFAVYTLIKFKELLHEKYEFREVDLFITIAIWWGILFQIGSLALRGALLVAWPVSYELSVVLQGGFMVSMLIIAGIIDIIIGIKILKLGDLLSSLMKAYAILALVAGVMEISIILMPLVVLVMVPASAIVLGLIFFKAGEQVEFV